MFRFLTVLVVLAPCLAQQEDPARTKMEEMKLLGRKVALAFISIEKLQLSVDQMKLLIPLCAKIQTLQRAYNTNRVKLLDEQEKAFGDFKKEDIQNVGFSKPVEKGAAEAEHKGKMLNKKFYDDVNTVEAEISKVLSQDQLKLLQTIDQNLDGIGEFYKKVKKTLPADQLPPGGAAGKPPQIDPKNPGNPGDLSALDNQMKNAKDGKALEEFVAKVRKMNDAEFDSEKEELVTELVRLKKWDITRADNEMDFFRDAIAALREVRALPKERVGDMAASILNNAAPKSKEEKIRKELGDIHKVEYGALGPVGKFFINGYLIELFCKLTGEKAPPETDIVETGKKKPSDAECCCGKNCRCSPCCCAADESEGKVSELRRDINLLNLINGMNFSLHQVLHIKAAAEEAKENKPANFNTTVDPNAADTLIGHLQGVLKILEAGKQLTESQVSNLLAAQKAVAASTRTRGVKAQPRKKLDESVECVEHVLFESQKQTLVDYKPCLIPPKNLKDPVRVGQAKDDGPIIKIMERFRKIPKQEYENNKGRILDRAVEEFQGRFGTLSEEKKANLRGRIADFAERIRKLTNEEFELDKSDLAKEGSTIFDKKGTLEDELAKYDDDEKVLHGKIVAFLLDGSIIPILENRAEQLRLANAGKPIDLDSISPADSCKRQGGCAIKEK